MYRTVHVTVLLLSITLSVACDVAGDDGPISREDANDVASAVGSLVADSEASAASTTGDIIDFAMSPEVSNLTHSGGSGSFSFQFDLDCFDATGAAMPACGTGTDTINASVDSSGTVALPRFNAEFTHAAQWTVAGLSSSLVTLSGESSLSSQGMLQSLSGSASRASSVNYSATFNDVAYDHDLYRFVGGTIQYSVDLERTGQLGGTIRNRAVTASVTVEFSPSGPAVITVDGAYQYELSSDGTIVFSGSGSFGTGA